MIRMFLRVLGDDYAGPMRRTMALMIAAAVAEGLSYALVLPVLDALLGDRPEDAWPWLMGFTAAFVGYAVLRFASDLSGFRVGTTMLHGLYRRLGHHLAELPLGWFRPDRVGSVSVIASRGVLQAMSVCAHVLGPFIAACVTPLTIVAVLLAYSWQLGIAALVAVPVVVLVQTRSGKAMIAADRDRAHRDHEAAGRVIEYVQAQPVLRAGGRAGERFDLLDDALVEVQRTTRRSTMTALPGVVGLTMVVQAAFTALLVLGTLLALGGHLGTVELVSALVLAARCADPLLSLAEMGGQLRAARGELERLDEVLRTPPLPEPAEPQHPSGHDLELAEATYRPTGRSVIDQVTLHVPQGDRLAVVGPSGAGKTTLLQLIARFHDVDGGAIRIGGVDVRSMSSAVLARQVAMVFQDVYLFDGTLEENVRLGRPEAAAGALRDAATAAQLDEVVARLPGGWEASVGEGGRLLSGGERQRVSIARALLKDAPVVLLDEVTSALDPVNEAAVVAGIDRLMAGRTVVTVTHRLSTIRGADQIALIDGGQVVEVGTHEELMLRAGRYADLWGAPRPA